MSQGRGAAAAPRKGIRPRSGVGVVTAGEFPTHLHQAQLDEAADNGRHVFTGDETHQNADDPIEARAINRSAE